jgi:hypothetical protein
MKNIQAQYRDLLEGKMSKANFMRNVRMEFPQHVTNVSSYEDSIKILKGKRILSEAPEGVYGHNPNAETPKKPGIDQLNYYQVYHGIQYELAKMPEITDENYIKARQKVVDTILKDPDAYRELQLANFKAVKVMDEDLKMKEVKPDNLVDKPNGMKVLQKNAKANTENTLEKKEKKKAKNPKGIKVQTQAPKKVAGVKAFPTPGKETVKTLKEHILDEMTKINPEHEHFNVGARVKKKDNSLVGEITEWDGDTATVKTDDGQIHHIQGNILTKKDIPNPEEKPAENPAAKMSDIGNPAQNWLSDMNADKDKPSRPNTLRSLKEKLMKAVKEILGEKELEEKRAIIVPQAANDDQISQLVKTKMPGTRSGDTLDIIRK